jgi:quinol monooxygenase YgiN
LVESVAPRVAQFGVKSFPDLAGGAEDGGGRLDPSLDGAPHVGRRSRLRGTLMTIIVRAELQLLPGKREEFIKGAAALAAASSAEVGTLRYEWFSCDDPTVFVVIEEYADSDAALAHNQHCEELLRSMTEVVELTSVHVHGRLGPDLEAWVAENPSAHAHPPMFQQEHGTI